MRLDSWTSFLSFYPNLSFSYRDDFVADVGKWAGNYDGELVENWVDFDRNWVDFDGNWVDEFEQHIDMETVILAA